MNTDILCHKCGNLDPFDGNINILAKCSICGSLIDPKKKISYSNERRL